MIVIEKKIKKKQSPNKEIMDRFLRNKVAVLSLIIFAAIVFVSIFADVIVDYQHCIEQNLSERFQKPSSEHWFGTDSYGCCS